MTTVQNAFSAEQTVDGFEDSADDVTLAPCSFAQQRMWLLERMENGSGVYNIQLGVRFTGPLDTEALADTVTEIVRRHEILRTTFELEDDELVQVIAAPAPVHPEFTDLSGHADPEAALAELAASELGVPFDTEHGPLLRARLARLAEREHVLLLVVDHLVCDGMSLKVLHDEITAIYPALHRGEDSPLPELAVQYADYAIWQRERLSGPVFDEQLDYWRGRLADPPERLTLPTRSGTHPADPACHRAGLPARLLSEVDGFAAAGTASRSAVLHAALCALLARYSGSGDIAVGGLLGNRNRTDLEPMVGFFVNTVVLRVDATDDPTATALLRRARDAALDAQDHQDVPFDRIVEELNPERGGAQPFFDVMFQYADQELGTVRADGVELRAYEPDAAPAPVTLVLNALERGGGVDLVWDYDRGQLDEHTMTALHRHYVRLLHNMVTEPSTKVSELSIMDETEAAWITSWSTPAEPAVPGRLLHEVFTDAVAAHPGGLAISARGSRMSYHELDERSNRLAHWLRANGVGRDCLVGVCLPRGIELALCVLAISKAGGAYLPLDPGYPSERLNGMLADAEPVVVLTDTALRHRVDVPGTAMLDLIWSEVDGLPGAPLPAIAGLDDTAYVIYTSGSTGRPKGVAVTHRGVATIVAEQRARFELGHADRVLQFASPSFDASVFELLTAWGAGAELAVLAESADRADLPGFLAEHGITAATLPPAALGALENVELPALRVLNVAGDVCPPAAATRWAGRVRFGNLYGPTEATIWSTAHRVSEQDGDGSVVPIGSALPGVRTHVLDAHGNPVPTGVWGELYLGGRVLARGYLNRPALTAERFVPDPFTPGARLYRTGDCARWTVHGGLEFGGRTDHQVKVRGHRVELGEVEQTMLAHPDVHAAVAMVREDSGVATLAGYVVAGGDTSGDTVRDWCRRTLPDYLVPSTVDVLAEFPLTASGKIDRAALPAAAETSHGEETGFEAPDGEFEELLAGMWAEVLGRDRIGRGEDFFELGGHSLLATLVVTRIGQELDVQVPVRALFDHPTLGEFALAVLETAAAD